MVFLSSRFLIFVRVRKTNLLLFRNAHMNLLHLHSFLPSFPTFLHGSLLPSHEGWVHPICICLTFLPPVFLSFSLYLSFLSLSKGDCLVPFLLEADNKPWLSAFKHKSLIKNDLLPCLIHRRFAEPSAFLFMLVWMRTSADSTLTSVPPRLICLWLVVMRGCPAVQLNSRERRKCSFTCSWAWK